MGDQKIKALDGTSFSINKGEFVVVAGPSGAGKSTFLNILGGMDTPSSGEITVDGNEISKYNTKQLTTYRRDDIGFVFQFYNLAQNLTALENIELAVQISKNPLNPEKVLEQVQFKQVMAKTTDTTEAFEKRLSSDMLKNQVVGSIRFTTGISKDFKKIINSLNPLNQWIDGWTVCREILCSASKCIFTYVFFVHMKESRG
jgi:ABC-type lipoprotein export system ATPase subunit